MRLKGKSKADFASKIVPCKHPQAGHQKMTFETWADTLPVARGLNVRGFNGDGSMFHQSEKARLRKMRRRRYCTRDHYANGTHHFGNAQPCVPTPFHGISGYTSCASMGEASFAHEL